MAIYHLHVKVIGRKAGSSAVASAAYRSASRMRDEHIGRVQDFSNKRGVVHSEILLPENAPEHLGDRERLWNDVEAFEVRKDAQLAREIEFAIPREMTECQGIELARDFAQAEFVDQGMIADLNVHWDIGEDGMPKPHAHVMLTSRDVLVIDEAGMVGTRQLERVLSHAAEAGAKVVLVGDPQQLQSIEAGAAFRSIHERHGMARIRHQPMGRQPRRMEAIQRVRLPQ